MKVPIVIGKVKDGIFTFWCPFCRREHRHGWPEKTEGGFRTAHCQGDSPFKKGGYYLATEDEVKYGKTFSDVP
jgi:hypothetical protein